MDSKIYNAYKLVKENQHQVEDEDEELSQNNILREISNGLKDILNSIDKYLSDRPQSKNVTWKLPDNPEDTSWLSDK